MKLMKRRNTEDSRQRMKSNQIESGQSMKRQELLHQDITQQILDAFHYVYKQLGYGFLEKVYENSLIHVLRQNGLDVKQQVPIDVYFEDVQVGHYFTDVIVNGAVILELKSAEVLQDADEAQLINYLRASQIEVGLLLNFGKRPKFKRKFFTNDRKCTRIEN